MRKLRLLPEGATFHVVARTNRLERFLASPEAKKLFVRTLYEAKEGFKPRVHAFAVMDNQVQLLLSPSRENPLPIVMRWLLGVYSARFNRLSGTRGSLWCGRNFSRPILGSEDFRIVEEYFLAHPYRDDLAWNDKKRGSRAPDPGPLDMCHSKEALPRLPFKRELRLGADPSITALPLAPDRLN